MSKVSKILSKLNSKALNRFALFVNSEFFNTSETLQVFTLELVAGVREDKAIDKAKTWAKLYPTEPYDDRRWRKLTNSVIRLLEDFFAIENTLEDQNLRIRGITKYSEDHNIVELKNKLDKKIAETIDKDQIISSQAAYDLYTTKRLLIDLESDFAKRKGSQAQKKLLGDFAELNRLLDMSYVIEKIRLSMLQGNYSLIFGIDQVEGDEQKIRQIIEKNGTFDHQLFKTYFQIFNLLKNDNEVYHFEYFVEYLSRLSKDNRKEALELYLNLGNYLVRKLNSGEDFYFEWLELMKFGLASKLILKNDLIDPIDYRNIVLAALRQKEYDWALNFVEQYKQLLSIEYRQSAYSFSKARIYWYSKNYQGVISTLQNVEYEDITYNLNSKLMLMTSLYELDEYDVLESTIKAFKVFLRRRRNISKNRKENFYKFCDVLFNILKGEENSDKKRLDKAQLIIAENPGLLSKWWLEEKLIEALQITKLNEEPRPISQ